MEHEEAVRLQMTEQYLLDELSPEAREEFEEHYFDCRECAADVGAGAAFVEKSKIVFQQEEEQERERAQTAPVPPPAPPWWELWFRPALVAPVMVILLVGAGYQNLVVLPAMEKALNTPQVVPVASLNIGTFSSTTEVSAQSGTGFVVRLRIPPQDGYTSYTASLYNPGQKLDGKPEWTVTVPSALAHNATASDPSVRDQWALQVPGAKRQTGTYTILVRGVTQSGSSEEVGRASFEFQEQ